MIVPLRAASCLLLISLLAACGAQPYKIKPSSTAESVLPAEAKAKMLLGPFDYDPRPRAIAVCYGAFFNRPEEVIATAQSLCPNEGRIERVAQDVFWNGCALFQPMRASYICFPGLEPPSPYR